MKKVFGGFTDEEIVTAPVSLNNISSVISVWTKYVDMAGMREVYRAGWLKKITSDDKKKTFKNPRVEKVWMVFCVHDEQAPFLEQYGSRQLATGHQPDFAYPLTECYHVSASIRPTLDAETEFVITLRQDVVKFSSSRREVIHDWITTLRNQLHELKVLESKSNLYTKAPRPAAQFGLQRDPNSPLPAPPPPPATAAPSAAPQGSAPAQAAGRSQPGTAAAAEVTPSEDPAAAAAAAGAAAAVPPGAAESAPPRRTAPSVPITVRAAPVTPPASPPAHWETFDDPGPAAAATQSPPVQPAPAAAAETATAPAETADQAESRHVTVISVGEALLLTVPDSAVAGGGADGAPAPPPPPVVPRPPVPAAAPVSSASARRAGPPPVRLPAAQQQETLSEWRPDRQLFGPAAGRAARAAANASVYERLSEASSPTAPAAGARQFFPASRHATVQRSHSSVPQQRPVPRPALQRQTSDTSLDSRAGPPPAAAASAGDRRAAAAAAAAREGGRQLSLREHQVLVLRREIAHRAGVRMLLPRRTAAAALALADGFGAVWLCGWRWKEQPALSCALHVGDRVLSVGGAAVTCAAEFARLVKQHSAPVMELVVQRMPHAMVIAMKRETEGQSLGVVRDGGSGEILQVSPDGLAASHGLPARSGSADGASLCNWYITEVNSRSVSLFSKGSELADRLAAVGREISLVVQPADLVHLLKRHLKTMRGYKQYVVQ